MTPAGEALRDEIRSLSKQSLAAFARRINELFPDHDIRAAQQIRFYLLSTLNRLVVDLLRGGAVFRDESIGGIVADLAAVPPNESADALAVVPRKFQRPVRLLLRLAASGNDPVLRMAVAHVTGIRFCELAVAGRLRNRLSPDVLARLGGLSVVVETSAIVAMAETPARLDEGKACFGDAVMHGFHVVVLDGSITEYLSGLEEAEMHLSALAHRTVGGGGALHSLSWKRWWVARAAVQHGVAADLLHQAGRDRAAHVLPATVAFVDMLRSVPHVLEGLGVRAVPGRLVSPERAREWRSAVASRQNRPVWDARVVHDAELLHHLQAVRRTSPLAFVVSTDSSLRLVWSDTMGPQAHAQVPATCLPAVASRLLAGLAPTTSVSPPWPERSDVWTLPVGYVARAVDLDDAAVSSLFDDQELLVPDHGSLDHEQPHPLCSRIHELVDDARLAVVATSETLLGAADEPVEPIVEAEIDAGRPGSDGDPFGAPVPRRRASLRVACRWLVLVVLAATALVVRWLSRVGSMARHRYRVLAAHQKLAAGLGLVAWAAAGVRFSASDDWSTLVLDVVLSALAVWSVAFVVLRPKR